jgi:hypothetical protein
LSVQFKFPVLELEFGGLHPDTRQVVLDLAAWSESLGFPAPVVTCIVRAPDNALEVGKFGWHQVATAADLRSHHYTPEQAAEVIKWLQGRCRPTEAWELITKNHGTAPHYHVARRDQQWRMTYPRKGEPP